MDGLDGLARFGLAQLAFVVVGPVGSAALGVAAGRDGKRGGAAMSLTVTQAYRFALDPTPAQQRELACHAGAARVAFNWSLARVTAVAGQRAAERSYGLTEKELTPALSWTLPALRREWNRAKNDVAPWWRE